MFTGEAEETVGSVTLTGRRYELVAAADGRVAGHQWVLGDAQPYGTLLLSVTAPEEPLLRELVDQLDAATWPVAQR